MSVAQSIRDAMVPIHPEGHKFIAGFAAVSVVLAFVWQPLFWIGLILTGWCALFFRDPERVVPVSDDLLVAPADGTVSSVGPFVPPAELELGDEPRTRISIFMNVFNCHVNRAPVRGTVRVSRHVDGKFLAADLDKASVENERHCVTMDTPLGQVGFVQIAGLVARRILNWTQAGETLGQGERVGLIRFGSRVDIFLPDGVTPRVSLGQTTIAGETVIAARGDAMETSPTPARI